MLPAKLCPPLDVSDIGQNKLGQKVGAGIALAQHLKRCDRVSKVAMGSGRLKRHDSSCREFDPASRAVWLIGP